MKNIRYNLISEVKNGIDSISRFYKDMKKQLIRLKKYENDLKRY